MTRRLIFILFLALAFFFVIVMPGGLTGCNGTLGALKEANDYSSLLGCVSVAQDGGKEVWTGYLRDSRGKEVMLFEFTPFGGEIDRITLFSRGASLPGAKDISPIAGRNSRKSSSSIIRRRKKFSAGGFQSALLTSALTLRGRSFSSQPKRRFTWCS